LLDAFGAFFGHPTAGARDGNHGAGQGSKQAVPTLRQKILMSIFRFRLLRCAQLAPGGHLRIKRVSPNVNPAVAHALKSLNFPLNSAGRIAWFCRVLADRS